MIPLGQGHAAKSTKLLLMGKLLQNWLCGGSVCAVAQSCDSSVCYAAGILSYFKLPIDAGWAQGLCQGPREVTAVQAHVRRVLLVCKERVLKHN